MKSVSYYLWKREKIVISKIGKYVVADFYCCYFFIWVKFYTLKETECYDHLLMDRIDMWVDINPNIKVIDKRVKANTSYYN